MLFYPNKCLLGQSVPIINGYYSPLINKSTQKHRSTFVQFYHRVFSLDEADALVLSGARSDCERYDGDMVGGRVSGE